VKIQSMLVVPLKEKKTLNFYPSANSLNKQRRMFSLRKKNSFLLKKESNDVHARTHKIKSNTKEKKNCYYSDLVVVAKR